MSLIAETIYEYDFDDRLLTETETVKNRCYIYTYDNLSRVIKRTTINYATGETVDEDTFDYDGAGNMRSPGTYLLPRGCALCFALLISHMLEHFVKHRWTILFIKNCPLWRKHFAICSFAYTYDICGSVTSESLSDKKGATTAEYTYSTYGNRISEEPYDYFILG